MVQIKKFSEANSRDISFCEKLIEKTTEEPKQMKTTPCIYLMYSLVCEYIIYNNETEKKLIMPVQSRESQLAQ